MRKKRIETLLISGGYEGDEKTGALAVPIYRTAAYKFINTESAEEIFAGEKEGFVYSRINNPTVDVLEKRMSLAENGEAGLATSSGMSAIALLAIHLAKDGGEIVSSDRIYGGTFNLFNKTLRSLGINVNFVDNPCKIDCWTQTITNKTRFLYLETPTNPTLDIFDIQKLTRLANSYNLPIVIDNTIATPILQNPLNLGADIVVHSLTKYIGGNGTDLGGIIIGKKEMIDKIRSEEYRDMGPCLSPESAFMFLLGLETLSVRMERHCKNALKVAKFLEKQLQISVVNYPGLINHPLNQTAKKQMKGFGGLLSFEINGTSEQTKIFIESLRLCSHVANLGDTKTLVIHPASTTHEQLGVKGRKNAGIPETLVRMSVGLEHPNDIIADIKSALKKI